MMTPGFIYQLWRTLFLLIALGVSAGTSAQQVFEETAPGSGSFTVPDGVEEITVEVWGAGGSGSRDGGGGGAYSTETLMVGAGNSIPYYVGAGAASNSTSPGEASWFQSTAGVFAEGGDSPDGSGGADGGVLGLFSGGAGADRINFGSGGGGGSSAGSSQNGNPGSGSSGGAAPQDGGDGGDGGGAGFFAGGNGQSGARPGGGGGGGGFGFLFGSGLAGAGANGQIRITYLSSAEVPLCSDLFGSGINPNIPEGSGLNLSAFDPRNPQSWPANDVIPAGDNVYVQRNFTGNNVSLTVEGQTRVLVDGDLTISGNNFLFNADGDAGNLLLIVDGDLTFENNAEINGVIYATGDINFGNNSVIVGALASEGTIDIGGGNSNLTYDPDAVNQVDFGGACDSGQASEELDHIRIVHPGIGLTCQPADIELLACSDASCSNLYGEPVDIALQPSGWSPSASIRFTGSTDVRFQRSIEEIVNLGASSISPSPDNGVVCVAPDGSASCAIEFRDVGFVFDMPDLVAGVADTFTMAAVEKDAQSGQCAELFANETRIIDFGTTYLNPGAIGRDASFATEINDTAVASDGSGQTGIPVAFDGNGFATLNIQYDDAGRNSLSASFTEPGQPDGGTLVIEGTSDYVSVPYGLCLIPEQQCSVADLSCGNTMPAGLPFDVVPKAYRFSADVDSLACADKLATPSFEASQVPISHQKLFPSGGVEGDLVETGLSFGLGDQSLTLTEVGVFSLLTEAVPGGYLGRDLPESDIATSARMVPDQLLISQVDDGAFQASCGSFTYTGQFFSWDSALVPELAIRALNGQSPRQLTVNYTEPDVIGQLGADRFTVSVPNADSTATLNDASSTPFPFRTDPDSATLSSGVRDSVTPGIVRYRFNAADVFLYPKTKDGQVEPFPPDLLFLLEPMTDTDNISVTDIPSGGLEISPKAPFEMRYGRFVLSNVYGPENLEAGEVLEMPFSTEYWNGSRFVLNTADSCTDWSTADITNTEVHHTLGTDSGLLSSGVGGPLELDPAGTTGEDTLTWAVPQWLWDDQDGDGILEQPSALATFGVYRGNDRVIYWQER
jgi:MSHA biogenesis protein MshQ